MKRRRKIVLNFFERGRLAFIAFEHTYKELARRFGIARETVHRAIAGMPIRDRTRLKIIEEIFEEYQA
jgi:DNA-binding CsgD family transcriptional regulator